MTRAPNRVHTCPACVQPVTQADSWISIGAVRHHLTCRPAMRGRPALGAAGRGDGNRHVVGVSLTRDQLQQIDEWRAVTGEARAVYLFVRGFNPPGQPGEKG